MQIARPNSAIISFSLAISLQVARAKHPYQLVSSRIGADEGEQRLINLPLVQEAHLGYKAPLINRIGIWPPAAPAYIAIWAGGEEADVLAIQESWRDDRNIMQMARPLPWSLRYKHRPAMVSTPMRCMKCPTASPCIHMARGARAACAIIRPLAL